MLGTSYVHMLEGRLRIKVSEIRGFQNKAVEIQSAVSCLKGVWQVKANHVTGNLLVLFDPDMTNHYHIIGSLKDLGCLHTDTVVPRRSAIEWCDVIVGPLAQSMIERAILALI